MVIYAAETCAGIREYQDCSPSAVSTLWRGYENEVNPLASNCNFESGSSKSTSPPNESNFASSSASHNKSTNDASKHADIVKLAAPLSKEQLIELLSAAANISPAVKELIFQASIASPASRRIMIRNIHYNTSDERFAQHFKVFGKLEDAAIVRERSGRSKGFGFVTFSDINAMYKCLNSALYLDGRKLFVKVAADPFSEFLVDGVPVQGRCSRRKIFIRNLSANCDANVLRESFSRYGTIEECSVVYGPNGVSKRFAFITYDKQDSAVRAAAEPQQTLMGRVIFVSMAKSGMTAGKDSFNEENKKTVDPGYMNSYIPNNCSLFEKHQQYSHDIPSVSSNNAMYTLNATTTTFADLDRLSDSPFPSSSAFPVLFPSWQPDQPKSQPRDTDDDWDLTREFTDYACGLKDAIF